ncbi:MAG: HAD family hydrolase [Atopobiaceae bacterium]
MIRLALSDMDNTLIPFGNPHVSKRTLDAIADARAAGVEFGPSTGRDYHELLRFFQGDASAFQTGVMSSGKKVMVDGEIVSLSLIDHGPLERMAEMLEDVPDVFLVAYPADTDITNPVWVIAADPEQVPTFQRRFKFEPHLVEQVPDVPLIAATLAATSGRPACRTIETKLRPAFPEFDIVSPTPDWYDIVPHGVSKASGLHILMEKLGLKDGEVVVFGDAANDVPVFHEVTNSVAVANATKEVAALARYHIGACADDGVAAALEDIARAAERGTLPDFMVEEDAARGEASEDGAF